MTKILLLICVSSILSVGLCQGVYSIAPLYDTSTVNWTCTKKGGYINAVIPCWTSSGQDAYCQYNYQQAIYYSFQQIDISVDACYYCIRNQDPNLLIDTVVSNIRSYGINTTTIWLNLTISSYARWSTSNYNNYQFIRSLITRIGQYNLVAGVYSNSLDWGVILGTYWDDTIGSALAWYAGGSSPNFYDWSSYSFGSYTAPSMKSWTVGGMCGVFVHGLWHP